jgi:YHS domain-containing protein
VLLRAILIGIVLLLIARAFWRVVDGLIEGVGGRPRKTVRGAKRLLRDPVCGTYVVPNPLLSLTTSGGTVYFCSESCRQKFGARK